MTTLALSLTYVVAWLALQTDVRVIAYQTVIYAGLTCLSIVIVAILTVIGSTIGCTDTLLTFVWTGETGAIDSQFVIVVNGVVDGVALSGRKGCQEQHETEDSDCVSIHFQHYIKS